MHLGGAGLGAGGLLLLLRQRQVDAGELALQRLHLAGGAATQIRSVCAEYPRTASESQRAWAGRTSFWSWSPKPGTLYLVQLRLQAAQAAVQGAACGPHIEDAIQVLLEQTSQHSCPPQTVSAGIPLNSV
jgi:hypothetical protein